MDGTATFTTEVSSTAISCPASTIATSTAGLAARRRAGLAGSRSPAEMPAARSLLTEISVMPSSLQQI